MKNNIKIFKTIQTFTSLCIISLTSTLYANNLNENRPEVYTIDMPKWFESQRVHIHTRLSQNMGLNTYSTLFNTFSSEIEQLGPKVITRFMKGTEEGAWWETSVGDTAKIVQQKGNVAKELIEDASSRGIHSVAYYRHMEDRWVEVNHPTWLARKSNKTPYLAKYKEDANGNFIFVNDKIVPTNEKDATTWGPWVSFSSPYSTNFIFKRLEELSKLGISGVYYDFKHQPDLDYSPYSMKRYKEWSNGGTYGTNTIKTMQFRQMVLSEFFNGSRTALKRYNSQGVLIVSVRSVSLDTLRHSVDSPKYEPTYEKALGGLASTSTMLLDVVNAYPHVWIPKYIKDTEAALETTAARYLTYGTIYNRDIDEAEATNIENLRPNYMKIFELNDKISKAMIEVQPFRHARVVVNGTHIISTKNHINTNVTSTWNTLNNIHVPTGYASTLQMIKGGIDPATKYLIFPQHSRSQLTTALSRQIAAHESTGGKILFKNDLSGAWTTQIKLSSPIQLRGGTSAVGFVPYISNNGKRVIVNISANNTSNLSVFLSEAIFSNLHTVTENITNTIITPTKVTGGWLIRVPKIRYMAQLEISLNNIDTTPDAFTFIKQINVERKTRITSNTITISGINNDTPISIVRGSYSINGGTYTSNTGSINNGDTVTLQHTSAYSYRRSKMTTLTIGNVTGKFRTITKKRTTIIDTTPDAFTFIKQINVERKTRITSNTITISGINNDTPISIVRGSYSINGGTYTSNTGSINNGDTVTLQHTSAYSYRRSKMTTLTIGNVTGKFRTITKKRTP